MLEWTTLSIEFLDRYWDREAHSKTSLLHHDVLRLLAMSPSNQQTIVEREGGDAEGCA